MVSIWILLIIDHTSLIHQMAKPTVTAQRATPYTFLKFVFSPELNLTLEVFTSFPMELGFFIQIISVDGKHHSFKQCSIIVKIQVSLQTNKSITLVFFQVKPQQQQPLHQPHQLK